MEHIQMAKDVEFSRIILGFWRLIDWKLSDKELVNFLESCMDIGVTTMDHADVYGNYTIEEMFGRAIKLKPEIKNRMQIVTKCGIVYPSDVARVKYYDYRKEYIIGQVEKSLKYMNIDTIDTLLLHRPSSFYNPEEVSGAFDELYKSGKVKSFGVSNFNTFQFDTLKSYLNVPLVTNQIELSCLCIDNMENGVIDQCLREKISPMIWSPLAGGRIFTEQTEEVVRVREALEQVREDFNAASIDEIAFAWILSHPVKPLPITGSGEMRFVETAVNSLQHKLNEEQWHMILTALRGRKVL